MSYLNTVQQIRTSAVAVNPNGSFDHGRIVDFSQNFDRKMPYIWLYPFTITDAGADDNLDSSTIIVGFFRQDRPDTSVQERETIIGEMDVLCSAFLEHLKENNTISVTGVTREPQYGFHQGHVSGFACRFTYQNLAPC